VRGLYIDSREVYETTRGGRTGREGCAGGVERGREDANGGPGVAPRPGESAEGGNPGVDGFFFRRDEITDQLAILLRICQVSPSDATGPMASAGPDGRAPTPLPKNERRNDS
jgi:hypothetical protein